ncbi:hypothetical protein QTJ16_005269 [Diplocarpon rosae]|uniref:Uncharacterized protein n=1 Tax=Diplocarpon rosae TaxID=946125 RepID=A0AAD9SZN1_9HELO|nr:hypothetical protein QTJ16_005269 [Diplocarpon rosae]
MRCAEGISFKPHCSAFVSIVKVQTQETGLVIYSTKLYLTCKEGFVAEKMKTLPLARRPIRVTDSKSSFNRDDPE